MKRRLFSVILVVAILNSILIFPSYAMDEFDD